MQNLAHSLKDLSKLRRRVTVGLNSEAHHTLKRPIHFYRKDSISDRTRLEQTDAMPLNMVVAAITLCNTAYLDARCRRWRNAERGTPVPDSLPAAHFARGLGAHRDHWNLHLEGLDQAVRYGSPEPARNAALFIGPFADLCSMAVLGGGVPGNRMGATTCCRAGWPATTA